jgi:hypothetical protein
MNSMDQGNDLHHGFRSAWAFGDLLGVPDVQRWLRWPFHRLWRGLGCLCNVHSGPLVFARFLNQEMAKRVSVYIYLFQSICNTLSPGPIGSRMWL